MRFAIISCPTKLSKLTPPQIFSGDIPFKDTSYLPLLRRNVVKCAKRTPKPQPQDDIGREFDDDIWSLIEECWSQEPSDRPTAAKVSLRLGGVNGCLVNPAEMYKKEIAALTEELARVKAARQDLETELSRRELELKKELDEERDLRRQVESARQDFETELRKRVETNADERIKAARQYFETEIARRELEQAELKKELDEERDLRKQVEKNAADERIKAVPIHGPGVSPSEQMVNVQKPDVQVESPSIQNGTYFIKNRKENIYWYANGWRSFQVVAQTTGANSTETKVNEHSQIIQVLKG